jgi:hypothetical protein
MCERQKTVERTALFVREYWKETIKSKERERQTDSQTSFLPAKKGTTVVAHANRKSHKRVRYRSTTQGLPVRKLGESFNSKTTLNYSHIKRGKDNPYLHPCFF